ncbi:protein of unknown function [Aminobacter niigataensis]|nr:protein of unknown function [Aminobacter niigataensis]
MSVRRVATRVLRKSVQELAGPSRRRDHHQICHAMKEDVRAALEATGPTKSPTTSAATDQNALDSLNKAR